jgi:hypothetical protein
LPDAFYQFLHALAFLNLIAPVTQTSEHCHLKLTALVLVLVLLLPPPVTSVTSYQD